MVPVDAAGAEVGLPPRAETKSVVEDGDDAAGAKPGDEDGREPAEV